MNHLVSNGSQPGRFQFQEPLILESGEALESPHIAYRSWGKLNPKRNNAILICHALTGSDDVDLWWPGLIGPGRALDPAHDFILCSNTLGSCYGTSGPATINPQIGRRYGSAFPEISVGDMVRLQRQLVAALGIEQIALVIGGSLGGMQALEWGAQARDRVAAVVAIASSDRQSAWGIAYSEAQRLAILTDPKWRNGDYPPNDPPLKGLKTARAVAMLSYRHWGELNTRFGRTRRQGRFEVTNWLVHHGESLAGRFDAGSYVTLTRAMDTHDIERVREESPVTQLHASFPPTLVVGITSDLLYPPEEQIRLASRLPGSDLVWLESQHGHDAFLIEIEALNALIGSYRTRLGTGSTTRQITRRDLTCPV